MNLPFGSFQSSRLADALSPGIESLNDLIGSSEKDFLLIGEKLQDFHQKASHIANMTTDAGKHLGGAEMSKVIEKFKNVQDMAQDSHSGYASEKETLDQIMISFSKIRPPLVAFEKIVRNLNVLCNFIKIEIARLGRNDTGFNSLADDVRRMALTAGTKTTDLVNRADTLKPMLHANLSLINKLESTNEKQANLILQKLVSDIELLNEKTNTSASAMKTVTEKWQNISASMASVVESLQFHDITRQRFEHVRDALIELPHRINENKNERNGLQKLFHLPARQNEKAGVGGVKKADIIAGICGLETAQLQNARDGFVSAVEHILDNLNNIAGTSGSMSDEIAKITGGGRDSKGSFIFELENDVGYLDNCFNECMKLNNELSAAMLEVSQTASGMSVFMKQMQKISIEMQMLALNARVRAAHLGDQGETLGVLADSIHQSSAETTSQVNLISTNLQDIITHAESLAAKVNQENLIFQDKAVKIKEQLGQIIEAIKIIDKNLQTLMPRIDAAGNELAGDIEQLTTHFTLHHTVDEKINAIALSLSEISAKAKPKKKAAISGENNTHLHDLTRRYTMHTERETHLQTTGAQTVVAAVAVAALPSAIPPCQPETKDDELGDNVEMF